MSRRRFLASVGAVGAGALTIGSLGCASAADALQLAGPARPRVAAIMTSFHPSSHAHVILENFLEPYLFNGQPTDPGVDVVAFFVDQVRREDTRTSGRSLPLRTSLMFSR